MTITTLPALFCLFQLFVFVYERKDGLITYCGCVGEEVGVVCRQLEKQSQESIALSDWCIKARYQFFGFGEPFACQWQGAF